jgi:hypothetical protein
LPEIHKKELEQMKDGLSGKKIVIFQDESTDIEQRDVLNILFLEFDCKGCKPLLAETFFLEVISTYLLCFFILIFVNLWKLIMLQLLDQS